MTPKHILSALLPRRAAAEARADGGHLDAGILVCDIKDAGRAPTTWKGALFRLGFRARSVSKYGLFMEQRLV